MRGKNVFLSALACLGIVSGISGERVLAEDHDIVKFPPKLKMPTDEEWDEKTKRVQEKLNKRMNEMSNDYPGIREDDVYLHEYFKIAGCSTDDLKAKIDAGIARILKNGTCETITKNDFASSIYGG